jgi:hypothetical protein
VELPESAWEPALKRGQLHNASFRILQVPPPYDLHEYGFALSWLGEQHVDIHPAHDAWIVLAFPDEWGQRKKLRTTWLAIHMDLHHHRVRLARCYSVTGDDAQVRNPHGADLSNRQILLIGCGSLGSSTALALAQEGVGGITLADSDIYEPGNAVRHQVGLPMFGQPKDWAMAKRIQEVASFCRVENLGMGVGHNRVPGEGRDFQKA